MALNSRLMDEAAVKRALIRIAHEIVEHNRGTEGLALVGIRRRGVPLARIISQNIAAIEGFSKDDPVVMISSNYHMDRAVRNAADAGFSNVMRLPAPSGILAYGANMLSEVVLDINAIVKAR